MASRRTTRNSSSPYARPTASPETPGTSGASNTKGKAKGKGKATSQQVDADLLNQLIQQQQLMAKQQEKLEKQLENVTNAATKLGNTGATSGISGTGVNDNVMDVNQGQLPSPFISITHDVDSHVPVSIKGKIAKSEYINLAFLLEGSLDANREQTFDIHVGGLSGLGGNESGNIVLRGPGPRRRIDSIETWTDAFLVFTHIFTKTHPTRHHELLAYMRNIRRAAKYGGVGYKIYDEKFRLAQADAPGRSWAAIDS